MEITKKGISLMKFFLFAPVAIFISHIFQNFDGELAGVGAFLVFWGAVIYGYFS